jgi:uncharacterized membrane protein YdjX (TVP38/TMEM64 family)
LFLIPGTPKDVLTYVVGLTSIKARDFLLLSTVARIPSIITSTLIGANVMAGNYTVSFIIFGLTLILGLGGIYLNNKVIKRQTQKPTTKRLSTSTKT